MDGGENGGRRSQDIGTRLVASMDAVYFRNFIAIGPVAGGVSGSPAILMVATFTVHRGSMRRRVNCCSCWSGVPKPRMTFT